MPEGFLTWEQFQVWLVSPVALVAIVQVLKVLEAFIRLKTGHPVAPGEGVTDRYAILLTGVVAGIIQIAAEMLRTTPAPDPMLWIGLQALVLWAVSTLYYAIGKAIRGRAGGLGS